MAFKNKRLGGEVRVQSSMGRCLKVRHTFFFLFYRQRGFHKEGCLFFIPLQRDQT